MSLLASLTPYTIPCTWDGLGYHKHFLNINALTPETSLVLDRPVSTWNQHPLRLVHRALELI